MFEVAVGSWRDERNGEASGGEASRCMTVMT
jgi:hypothetical protein